MKRALVVGGGLGGLLVSTLLAREGIDVVLRERSGHLGGRARSIEHAGARVNLGPHALYRRGPAHDLLRSLGVPCHGGVPPLEGKVLRAGALHALPATPWSLLATTALAVHEKLAAARYLSPLGQAPDCTVEDWLAGAPAGAAELLRAAIRVATYTNAPALQSARRAQAQVRAAQRGVLYVDGGWQSLVDGLRDAATAAGVRIELEAEVGALPDDVAVVVSGPPSLARALGLPVPELVPVRAACLDLVLDRLPRPEARFVLGLDAPVYLSEHAGIAKLSEGAAVLHVAEYLAPGEVGDRARLEALLDVAQPGWREGVRFERFLPAMEVSGRVDRPGGTVPDRLGGAWLVGDWVGEEGMLLDRVAASARRVATAVLADAQAVAA